MKDKLAQMNAMLADVVQLLSTDEDTILFVFGDHGMTPDGNHGGATTNELDAALFVYSARAIDRMLLIGESDKSSLFRQVKQTDLTPTLALLLGIPVPFGNLGSIIPELFLRSSLPLSFGTTGDSLQLPQVCPCIRCFSRKRKPD